MYYVNTYGFSISRFETSSRDPSSVAHAMKRLVEYILETDPSVNSSIPPQL